MRILLIENDAQYAEKLTRMAKACCPPGLEVCHADNPAHASDLLESRYFDVCFLEYTFEGPETGLDVLRKHHRTATLTAFVVLTSSASKELAFEALTLGAIDYQIKARFTEFEMAKCISYSMYIKHREVTFQTEALRDSLTGLGNRALFEEQIRQAANRAERDGEKLGLLIIDLDHFKPLNDKHGHQFGDQVLQMVAERIVEQTRASDVLARIGGDEFSAIIIRPKTAEHVHLVAEKIEKAITEMPYAINGKAVKISASVGSAILPDDSTSVDDLFNMADERMYKRKGAKKVTFRKSRDYMDAILH